MFSKEWEECYRKNTHLSIWPWSDLVSYVKRYVDISNPNFNVLELGCGAGANIPFFRSLDVNYYGIDGSQTIIGNLKQQFPEIKDNLVIGDFTQKIPFEKKFELIVDRSSLTCNSTLAIEQCINLISDKLSDNGVFIGIDWFSTSYFEYNNGKNTHDEYTKKDFDNGSFEHAGLVHFSSKEHLEKLFSKFKFLTLEHKIVKNVLNDLNENFAVWNFIVQKKIT
jgi:SAM-dependent methyltransferase